ncbi:hypothetical protein FF1_019447 [Malus domestica]
MDEYSLAAGNRPTEKKKGQWQDDWVLCLCTTRRAVAAELQLRQQQTRSRNMSRASEFQQWSPQNLTCPFYPAASSFSEKVVLPERTGEVEKEDLWDELERGPGLSYDNYMDATVGNGVPENPTCPPLPFT